MKKLIIILLLSLVIIITSLYLLRPIRDPDFFWHLSTGRWIVENRTLPDQDPFSYTTPRLLSDRELFILRSYWLSQVIYWFDYSLLGFNGIVLLRFFIVSLLLVLIYKRIYQWTKDNLTGLVLLLILIINLLTVYPPDRPQVWSFLFFALLLLLLDKKRYALLVPLMLIWSNMHGGYMLGSIFISLYLFEGALRFYKKEPVEKGLFIGGILAIIAGFLNPCTYQAFLQTIKMPSSMRGYVIEYKSTIEAFLRTGDLVMPFYWAFLLMSTISLTVGLIKRKIGLKDIIAFAGLGFFSFTQIRYIAFFYIWSAPYGASFLNSLKPWLRYSLCTLLIIGSLYIPILLQEYNNIKNIKGFSSGRWVSGYYPEGGLRFIKANNLKGNMYNFYDWGGYLIWSFYPEKRVFIDGRQLYEYLFMQSMSIDQAQREPLIKGMPFWKALLKSYDIKFILIPIFDTLGNVSGLLSALIDDPEWVPLFFKDNSVIFVKNTRENYSVIYRYGIPKDFILDDLIGVVEAMLKRSPQHISLYISLGDLNVKAKRYEKAMEIYEKGLQLQPFNSVLKKRKETLGILMKNR